MPILPERSVGMGFFGSKKRVPPPHPRQEPRFDGPLTADRAAEIFGGSADFIYNQF